METITLREARLNAGLSQGKAAELSHIPQTTISHYEKNLCKPSKARFEKLCSIYGYSTNEVVYPEDNRINKKLLPVKDTYSDLRYIIECQKAVMESQRQMLVMQQQLLEGRNNG
jgi:transcriptional regulator with XRE-family HTH domain